MRGCPAISYGWGRGHVRINNHAFKRFGLAQVAATPAALRDAVASALESGRTAIDFSDLPSAASFVLAEVETRVPETVHAAPGESGSRLMLSPLSGSARSPSGALLPQRP